MIRYHSGLSINVFAYMYVCIQACRGQRRCWILLKLELQVVVSHHTGMLEIKLETSGRVGKICNTWAIASSNTVVLTCIVVRENHKFSRFQNILSFSIPSHSQSFFRQPGKDSLSVLVYEYLAVCKLSSSTRAVGALNPWSISPACCDCSTI